MQDTQLSEENSAAPDCQAALEQMCRALAKVQDPALILDFLTCLLTPVELKDIAKRWLIVSEIARGTTQREIAHSFGMSLCKITRGSRELKKENSAFRALLAIAEKNAGSDAHV